ncbi:hypothetical protein [Kribbella sp. NPDC006257]|uniref:hypothetical protein n=1 Tax=Kribbella sp. NPDC006257 TaxID=3156738 RepID=UPI0033A8E1E2
MNDNLSRERLIARTDQAEDAARTAYPSDTSGTWTVWDHVNDREIESGISEADARELAEGDAASTMQIGADLEGRIDGIACMAAIRRAEANVARIREEADAAAAESDRDAELDRWHTDDTAASAKAEQAIDSQAPDFCGQLTDA